MGIEWFNIHTYDENQIKNYVMNRGGNYVIAVHMQKPDKTFSGYKIIYVGKSENLAKRLLEHLSDSEQNLKLRDYVKGNLLAVIFCYTSSETDRKNIEHTLYHRYKSTICNDKEPDGSTVDINLPN